MEVKISDMLVFEDENGSSYQDCVCAMDSIPVHIAYTKDEEDEYFHTIICNKFDIHLDSFYSIISIAKNDEGYFDKHKYKLKEVWRRTDDYTYNKILEISDDIEIEITYE